MRELLKKGGYLSIDEDVLRRALRLFSFRISMALADNNPAFIADAYEQAENLPSSSTEIRLSQSDIILNGELVSSHDSAVTLCFKKSTPYAMKCIDTTEQRKLISMHSQLKHANIVDFELVDKRFMIMPLYPTTLEHLKYVDDDTAMKLWQSMGGALAHLHSTSLAHMDVKPENIFISTCGSFILGDLGSVAGFGEKTKSTRAYIPHDMQGQNTNTQTAMAEVDWWMLAMVFCEKAAGHNVGGGSRELKRGEIHDMLSQHQRMRQFWLLFAAKLNSS
jgi:hypothetical protein